jgi:SAM-dependent methyltransferase
MENRRSEINNDLDLTEVMAQIRRNAQKRKLQSVQNGSSFTPLSQPSEPRQLSSLPPADPPPPELKMQPELERRNQYQIGDLLGFHDEAFVRNAYQVILKREPDDAGFAQCIKNLRSGRYSKIDILRSLRFSPEGRKADVSVAGLSRASLFRKIYRVPILGYVAQLVVAIFRLPVLIANYRRLESHTAAQFDRVADHVNEVTAHFSGTNQRLSEADWRQSETARAQFTAIEALKTNYRIQIESLLAEHEKFVQEQGAARVEFATRLDHADHQLLDHAKFQELQKAELQTLKDQLDQHVQRISERLQNIRMDIAQQENHLARLIETGNIAISAVPGPAPDTHQDHLLDSLYRSLENELRGTPAEIKEDVKAYLPVLRAAEITADVLDIGCGRGEWLEVLGEAGIQARGVDSNRILVRQCQELNLDVTEAEALTYLRTLKEQSLSAVTALHFAEHLTLQNLVSFLDEAARTLKPQGLLILETPNPENLLVGSCNFYLDPTHKNPIPIPTLKLLVEARGFQCQEIMKLHPVSAVQIEVKDQLTSHLNHYLYGPMNYAVIARRPEQA